MKYRTSLFKPKDKAEITRCTLFLFRRYGVRVPAKAVAKEMQWTKATYAKNALRWGWDQFLDRKTGTYPVLAVGVWAWAVDKYKGFGGTSHVRVSRLRKALSRAFAAS